MVDIEHVLDYQIICKTSLLLVPQKEFQFFFKYANKISSIWVEDPRSARAILWLYKFKV